MCKCDFCGRERESQRGWFKIVNARKKVTKQACPFCGKEEEVFLVGIQEDFIRYQDEQQLQTIIIGG